METVERIIFAASSALLFIAGLGTAVGLRAGFILTVALDLAKALHATAIHTIALNRFHMSAM